MALCIGVAYFGRKDPTPRLYPGSPELIAIASMSTTSGDPLVAHPGALTTLPHPDAPAALAAEPAPAPSTPFLSVIRDIPLTMSNIVTGDQGSTTASTSPALAPISYTVAADDTVWSIAGSFGVSPDSIIQANGLDANGDLTIGQKLLVPPIPGYLYGVRDGDTLVSIARHFAVSPSDIARVNALADPNALTVGTTLVIPGAKASTSTAPSASVAATVVSSRPDASEATTPGTYVVQPGDDVFSIATARGIDADSLAVANGLVAPYLVQPGQKLTIPTPAGAAPAPTPTATPPSRPSSYTIQSGDTLARIAQIFGLDPTALAAANGLNNPALIQPGERLVLAMSANRPESVQRPMPANRPPPVTRPESANRPESTNRPVARPAPPTAAPSTPTPVPPPPTPTPLPAPPTPAPRIPPRAAPHPAPVPAAVAPRIAVHNPSAGWNIVAVASKYLGYRYVWGGTSPSTGFDCSGFVWYVYGQAGRPIPRELSAQAASGQRVARANLQAGDIVFFDNTYEAGLSHDGIYIGGGRFISAADYGLGVIVSDLNDSYWSGHYDSATQTYLRGKTMAQSDPTRVYVGTYTATLPHVQGKAEGIYTFTLDEATGRLEPAGVAPGVVNPSFLALHPNRRFLYAVNETSETDGQPGGGVSAFAVDPATGNLTFLNRQPSHGTDPCHLAVNPNGTHVVVVNHGSGSVAAYPIQTDGSLGPASDVVQHTGSSVHPRAQLGPHAHSVNFDPTGRFALVCDKGIDKVMVYRLDEATGKLIPNDPPCGGSRPGSAPRHLAFHPTRPYAFVINEIASTLTTFALDEATGALREVDTVSTLPQGYTGRNSTADVRAHPNGRFVYGSNRGHDSIAIFAVDQATGKLTPLGHQSTQGAVPRNINLTPDGSLLLAANQNSDTIVAFRVDPQSGALTPTGAVTQVPTPVCIIFDPM